MAYPLIRSSEMIGWRRTNQLSWRTILLCNSPRRSYWTVSRRRTVGTCHRYVSLLHLFRVLIAIPAPVDLSQKLWDPDVGARDALSSFVIECCLNDAFCFDSWNDHAIVFDDLHDERRIVVLAHLLNGKYVSAPLDPSCKLFACDAPSTTHLSNLLCSSLPERWSLIKTS